jgi:non-ribosomal peptide synthetase component E (peptide arylation enzyme)
MQQAPLYHGDQFAKYHAQGLWSTRLFVDHVDEWARRQPGKPAIVEGSRTLTYAQVVAMSKNVAAALVKRGVAKGDVVAAQSPNWSELPIIHLATDRIGAIFLPLSEGFREKELLHLLEKSAAKVVFCPAVVRGEDQASFMRGLCAKLPRLPQVVAMRGEVVPGFTSFEAMAVDCDWGMDEAALAARRGSADSPSHVMVSSGSTGMPKCSLFSDNNTLVKLMQQYEQASDVSSTDVAAALAPAGTGSTGYNYPILAMLLHGGTSVLLEHWSGSDVDAALDLIEANSCTIAVAVPAQMVMLVNCVTASGRKAPKLRVITNAGAKLPPNIAEEAERIFSCKVQSIYGSSEAGATAMTSIHDPDEKRRTTVGRPLVGQEVVLLDDDGAPVPQGAPGEVCWRGANKSYGFLNDPQAAANTWDAQGWMHSGDLGLIDAEGYLCIVGRKKDMIIRGGQNINPGAIEELLLRHPGVAEIAIVPVADAILGERVAACVVARGGAQLTLASLKSFVLAEGLAAWHQPELLLEVAELPRNAGGKVDKKALSLSAALAAKAPTGRPAAATLT